MQAGRTQFEFELPGAGRGAATTSHAGDEVEADAAQQLDFICMLVLIVLIIAYGRHAGKSKMFLNGERGL